MANEIINILVNAYANVKQLDSANQRLTHTQHVAEQARLELADLDRQLTALGQGRRIKEVGDDFDHLSKRSAESAVQANKLNAELALLKQRRDDLQGVNRATAEQAEELSRVSAKIKEMTTANRALFKEERALNAEFVNQRAIFRDLESLMRDSGAREFELDIKHMRREFEQTGRAGELLATAIDKAEAKFRRAGNLQTAEKFREMGIAMRQASLDGREFSHTGEQLLTDFEALDTQLQRIASHIGDRFSPQLAEALREASSSFTKGEADAKGFVVQLRILQKEADRLDLKTMSNSIRRVADELEGIPPHLNRFENGLKRIVPSFNGFRRLLGGSNAELESFKRKMADASRIDENFARAMAIMSQRTIIFLTALTALIPFIGTFTAAIGSAVSGIFSMIAALSQLGGVLATLPGLFAAAAGAAGGLFGVIQPQGIISAFKQLGTAQKQNLANQEFGKPGTAAGGSGVDPVLQERKLHLERMQNRLQELEAERALQEARRQAMERLQAAEEELVRIRKQNTLDERDLKADVTGAKARLAGLKAEGAAPEAIAAAEADVEIAKKNLTKFRIDANAQEKKAERDYKDARLQGIRDVRNAEINLQQVRIANQLQAIAAENALSAARASGADQGLAGIRAYQLALAGLDPVQRKVALKLFDLRQQFQELTKSTRDQILNRFLDWLRDNEDLLPRIAHLANQFAEAVANVFGEFGKLIDTKEEQDRVFGIFEAGIPIVERLGGAAASLADAIIRIAEAAKPLTTFVTKGLEKFADAIDRATKASAKRPVVGANVDRPEHGGVGHPGGSNKREQSGLGSFFEGTEQTLKTVTGILKNLGEVLKNVFEAAKPAGDTLLKIFEKFTGHLADVTDKKKGSIAEFFKNQVPIIVEFGRVIGRIFEAVKNVTDVLTKPGKDGGKSQLEKTLIRIRTDLIPFIERMVIQFTTELMPAIEDFLGALGTIFETLMQPDGPLKTVLEIFTTIFDIINAVTDNSLGRFLIKWGLIFGVTTKLAGVMGKVADSLFGFSRLKAFTEFDKMKERIDNARDAFSKFRSGLSRVGDAAKTAGGKLQDAFKPIGTAFKTGWEKFTDQILVARIKMRDNMRKMAESVKTSRLSQALSNIFSGADGTGGIKGAVKRFGDQLKNVSGRIADLAKAASGKVLGALKTFGGAVANVTKAGLASLGGALANAGRAIVGFAGMIGKAGLALLTNPIFLVLAALAIAAILIWKNWDTIKPKLEAVWNKIKDVLGDFADFIGEKLEAIKGFVTDVIDFLKDHWEVILLIFTGPLGAVILALKHFGPKIVEVVGGLLDGAKEKLVAAWEIIKNFFTETIPGAFGTIKGIFTGLWDDIKSNLVDAWGFIFDKLDAAWTKIKNFFTQTIPGAFGRIAGVFTDLWDRIADTVSAGWEIILGFVRHFVATFASIIDSITSHIGLGSPLAFLERLDDTAPTRTPHNRGAGFATGGIPSAGTSGDGLVSPVPGGVYRVAEAGKPEAIMSLDPKYKARTLKIMDFVMQKLFDTSLIDLLKGIRGFGAGGFPSIFGGKSIFDMLPSGIGISTFGFAQGGIPSFAGGGLGGTDGHRGDPKKDSLGSAWHLIGVLRNLEIPTFSPGLLGDIAGGVLKFIKDKGLQYVIDGAQAFAGKVKDVAGVSGIDLIRNVLAQGGIVNGFAEGGIAVPSGLTYTSGFDTASFRSNLMGYSTTSAPGFASGGVVTRVEDGTGSTGKTPRDLRPNVNVTVHTSTEKADIDYIMRVAERRMQRF